MDKLVQEVISECTVSGNVIKLPEGNLDRKVYVKVQKLLEKIGGKWNRKAQGFIFENDPKELLTRIQTGESIDLIKKFKQDYQFFRTKDETADHIVKTTLVDLCKLKSLADWKILEPSAGDGSLIVGLHRRFEDVPKIDVYEKLEKNREKLQELPVNMLGIDFLESSEDEKYDLIIANPPFSKNQDIDHIYKMWSKLDKFGILVTVASKHWQISSNKKETKFKEWVKDKTPLIVELPENSFEGTKIEALLLCFTKI